MNQVYFNGNFYQVRTATNAGESPATNPEKFALVRIPAGWRLALGKLTYAHLLEIDGQKDKASEELATARTDDRTGLEALVRREVVRERQNRAPNVQRSYH